MIKNKNKPESAAALNPIEFISQLLSEAISAGASDIHFESFGHEVCVRFRIHGKLQHHQTLAPSSYSGIIARFKTLAQLDISQTLRPQDGRLQFIAEQAYPIRVHTCPTLYHEKMVLRILGDAKTVLLPEKLGMTDGQLSETLSALHTLQGLIICTGPTGSGKSMTLYALLKVLQAWSLAITTLEDPIEIPIPGISQIPIQPRLGMDYAHILKSVLRQDPDVIMLGEIRDEESAQLAVRAALTGHLVLTTLHTRDATSAITRLINMHVAPYDLADALSLVIAQRLVRVCCPYCQGKTCTICHNGVKERIGIFECLPINTEAKITICDSRSIAHELSPAFTLAQAFAQHQANGFAMPDEVSP